MAFIFPQKVLFKHCDPAGIVFYPRYFEIINDCIEAFFETQLHWPFEEALQSGGLPTAEVSAQFKTPSRHGDKLLLELKTEKLGQTSLHLNIVALEENETRFIAQSRLVRVGSTGCPEPWPDGIRTKLQDILESHNDN